MYLVVSLVVIPGVKWKEKVRSVYIDLSTRSLLISQIFENFQIIRLFLNFLNFFFFIFEIFFINVILFRVFQFLLSFKFQKPKNQNFSLFLIIFYFFPFLSSVTYFLDVLLRNVRSRSHLKFKKKIFATIYTAVLMHAGTTMLGTAV